MKSFSFHPRRSRKKQGEVYFVSWMPSWDFPTSGVEAIRDSRPLGEADLKSKHPGEAER